MAEHPNAAIARRLLEALDARDMAAIDELFSDDIVWHEIGRAEPRRGKDELRAMAGEMDYEIEAKLHDIVAGDDHTVLLAEATATRAGRTLHYRVAEVYHIRDGRVTERWAVSDDTAAIAAFFA